MTQLCLKGTITVGREPKIESERERERAGMWGNGGMRLANIKWTYLHYTRTSNAPSLSMLSPSSVLTQFSEILFAAAQTLSSLCAKWQYSQVVWTVQCARATHDTHTPISSVWWLPIYIACVCGRAYWSVRCANVSVDLLRCKTIFNNPSAVFTLTHSLTLPFPTSWVSTTRSDGT